MQKHKRLALRDRRRVVESEAVDGRDELISWEEAEWTRQVLGMNASDFALMLGVKPSVVYRGQKYPQTFLRSQEALLLRLGVNRRRHRLKGG